MGPLSIAALALKFPRLASFLRRFGKYILIGLLIAGACLAFARWRDNLVEAAEGRGFARAEQQYKAAVDEANRVAQRDQHQLDVMAATIGGLAQQRVQDIQLQVQPNIERVRNEAASNPVYRDCRVSDGMLGDINAARSAVDAGIRASNPQAD